MNAVITEYEPGKDLKPFVELFWEGNFNSKSSGRQSMQMIPNGCLDLIIHLNDLHCDLHDINAWYQSPDYMLIGLFTQPYEVQFGDHVKVFSIRFKPEGIYNIFGVPASLFMEDRFGLWSNRYQHRSGSVRFFLQKWQILDFSC